MKEGTLIATFELLPAFIITLSVKKTGISYLLVKLLYIVTRILFYSDVILTLSKRIPY